MKKNLFAFIFCSSLLLNAMNEEKPLLQEDEVDDSNPVQLLHITDPTVLKIMKSLNKRNKFGPNWQNEVGSFETEDNVDVISFLNEIASKYKVKTYFAVDDIDNAHRGEHRDGGYIYLQSRSEKLPEFTNGQHISKKFTEDELKKEMTAVKLRRAYNRGKKEGRQQCGAWCGVAWAAVLTTEAFGLLMFSLMNHDGYQFVSTLFQ